MKITWRTFPIDVGRLEMNWLERSREVRENEGGTRVQKIVPAHRYAICEFLGRIKTSTNLEEVSKEKCAFSQDGGQ